MSEQQCIFVGKPEECYILCMRSMKLHCLLNHRHLAVTNEGKHEILGIIEDIINNPERYKVISGQVGRRNQ